VSRNFQSPFSPGTFPLSYVASALVALAVLAPIGVLAALALGADVDLGGQTGGIVANTVGLTLLTVVGSVLVGVPMAVVTSHADLPARHLWLALLAAPLAVPSYIGAFAYFAAFGAGGEIETATGLATGPIRGLAGAALVMTLYTYPFVLLTTRASLQQLDGRMVDVARSLGLSLPAALWRVVLPRVMSARPISTTPIRRNSAAASRATTYRSRSPCRACTSFHMGYRSAGPTSIRAGSRS
jgi:iron(III) transport system permease protein